MQSGARGVGFTIMQKLFAAALLFAPAAAHAENWVAVTLTDDSSGLIIVGPGG